ncbi:MAG: hypothetical protein HUU38_05040 [Anaerolineales bacterium]|nr:hypothetical protein [Anaerolineales bacterium]
MDINWIPPEPRTGLARQWDTLIGPGATPAENALILAGGLVFTGVFLFLAGRAAPGWTPLQWIVLALLALDLSAGAVANATAAAKRWYHRAGQGFAHHFGFVAVHGAYVFLVAWLFRGMDWVYFGMVFGLLLAATLAVLRAPHYLQRPIAMFAFCAAVLINTFFPDALLSWFVPVLFLKLIVAHLVKEAPFR